MFCEENLVEDFRVVESVYGKHFPSVNENFIIVIQVLQVGNKRFCVFLKIAHGGHCYQLIDVAEVKIKKRRITTSNVGNFANRDVFQTFGFDDFARRRNEHHNNFVALCVGIFRSSHVLKLHSVVNFTNNYFIKNLVQNMPKPKIR